MVLKKSQVKEKNDEQTSTIINTLKEENEKIREILKKNGSDRLEAYNKHTMVKELRE